MNDVLTLANLALAALALMVSFGVPLFGAALWIGRTAHSMEQKLDNIAQQLGGMDQKLDGIPRQLGAKLDSVIKLLER